MTNPDPYLFNLFILHHLRPHLLHHNPLHLHLLHPQTLLHLHLLRHQTLHLLHPNLHFPHHLPKRLHHYDIQRSPGPDQSNVRQPC